MSPIYKILLSMASVLAAEALLPPCVHAQAWTNDQPASFVMGQSAFGMNGNAATAAGLYKPAQAIIDPVTGKVFVSDQWNNRVLRYPSTAAMTNGAAAEAVLGQTDFVSNSPNGNAGITSTSTFFEPAGIALDASGNLWVADQVNSRVLRFANAATIASGAAASEVLGEPDFITANNDEVSSSQMYYPIGLYCKGTTLWVADWYNSRILRFDNAASKANGAPANVVFGQPDFNTGFDDTYELVTPTATQLYFPTQIYVDGADNLWVSDQQFNRVMMFPNASTAPSSEAATKVLGQPNFLDNASGITASSFYYPSGVYGDGAGDIYVSDFENNRILIFENAASLPNGSAANIVLAQPDFVSNGNGDDANQLYSPELLFMPTSGTSLLAADYFNSRIMIWVPLVTLASTLTSFTGYLQDNGQALLQWQISGMGTGGAAYAQLEYSTNDTSGFMQVLNQQAIEPTAQNYSYLQASPAPGVNYYRLKLVAPDGSFTYSPIVTITVGVPSTGLKIYPNPAHTSVAITLPVNGTAVISIYNSAGILMQRLVSSVTVNNIDISRLAAGVYTITAVQGSNTTTGSFIKVN
jgi:sugar lactone lactonase YvrE